MTQTSTEFLLAYWQKKLGAPPPDSDKLEQLGSLNEIPASVVRVARALKSRRDAVSLITAYLRQDRRRHVEQFVDEVVSGGAAPETWKKGRVLVPDWSLQDQMTLPLRALLAPLGVSPSRRVVPSSSAWAASSSAVGAPCVEEPEADYLATVPRNATAFGAATMEPLANLDTAVARWIAARLALVVRARFAGDLSRADDAAAELVARDQWTPHTRAALRGLTREAQEPGPSSEAPPGFRGPDEWFEVR